MALGAEFADLRMESSQGTSIVVMDGRTKNVVARTTEGCGLRAFMGGAWGFSVVNELSASSMRAAAESAVKMARVARERAKVKFEIEQAKPATAREVYPCSERPSDVPLEEKVKFALDLDRSMKEVDERITSRNSRYDDSECERLVANSFGAMVSTFETWTMVACSAWAKSGEVVQRGHESSGKVGGYELVREDQTADIGRAASSQAIRLLDSKPAPAGKFVCVFDSKMTGLLAHEAFGHACEADAVLAGASVLENKIGEQVADPSVTLVDDPCIEKTFGYFGYDWEGVKASKHVLIERGVLKNYLHNVETGSRMKSGSNGAARAETYSSPPIIRMSNTYIAGGDWSAAELLADTSSGLLIQGGQYGYVEPSKGQFMFKCDEAYEIRKGEIGQRYRDVSLSGVILEVLNQVTGVADDFQVVDPGYCGKSGQSARTTDGGPHIRVADVVVGGLV